MNWSEVWRDLRCPLRLRDTRLDILNLLWTKASHGPLVFGTGHAWRADWVQVGNWGLRSFQSLQPHMCGRDSFAIHTDMLGLRSREG